jgi:hypothetical protein
MQTARPLQAPRKRTLTVSVLSVVLAIGAAIVGRTLGSEAYNLFLRPVAAAPTAAQLDTELAAVARRMKPTLPKRLDDVTTLTDIAYADKHMTYVYRLDTRGKAADAVMLAVRKVVAAQACGAGYKQALRQGYVFTFRYRDPTGGPLGEFSFSGSDCG